MIHAEYLIKNIQPVYMYFMSVFDKNGRLNEFRFKMHNLLIYTKLKCVILFFVNASHRDRNT